LYLKDPLHGREERAECTWQDGKGKGEKNKETGEGMERE